MNNCKLIDMKETYIKTLEKEFRENSDSTKAIGQKAYMKGKFEYYGLTSPIRRSIQKPFLVKQYLPTKDSLEEIVKILWNKPEREFQYFAQELFQKYEKKLEKHDIQLIEYMISHKSWWDTVDYLASNLLGTYFKIYPEQKKKYVEKWIASKNMWLQRSALIFQLKYKDEVDIQLLSYAIKSLLGSKEFFINKAIGWSLRQYSRFNPNWVKEFVAKTPLENLSKREALRLMS